MVSLDCLVLEMLILMEWSRGQRSCFERILTSHIQDNLNIKETNFLKCGNGFMASDCSYPQEMHAEIFRVKAHGVSNQFYFGKKEMYV